MPDDIHAAHPTPHMYVYIHIHVHVHVYISIYIPLTPGVLVYKVVSHVATFCLASESARPQRSGRPVGHEMPSESSETGLAADKFARYLSHLLLKVW